MNTNYVQCGEASSLLSGLPDECIDLTVTSPPYDDLRLYNGYIFDFRLIAKQLYRVTKPGGVVVWVVGDQTKNGSESLTSFKQAIYFREECGFNLHDTMIWSKGGFTAVGSLRTRYGSVFEYMLVMTKGRPKVFNPIKDRKNKWANTREHGTTRLPSGKLIPRPCNNLRGEFGQRFNIWTIPNPGIRGFEHPAPFPEAIPRDHIISWSNPGDIVLDPMCGSGTTLKMAKSLNRQYIGFDISEEYCELSRKRVELVHAD